MVGIIIAAHGTLASAALKTAAMFLGEQERVECISFEPGDSLETLLERFQAATGKLGTAEGLLLLTDIQGGSPCNVATLLQKTMENVRAVYGFNIPMLLEILDERERETKLEKILETALKTGAQAMGSVTTD